MSVEHVTLAPVDFSTVDFSTVLSSTRAEQKAAEEAVEAAAQEYIMESIEHLPAGDTVLSLPHLSLSIAISLKRLADATEKLAVLTEQSLEIGAQMLAVAGERERAEV